jgi:cardiolipin synthase
MNLDKEQLPGGNRLGSWRDTHLRIEGETALTLQAAFAVSWYNTTQEIFDAETYFPAVDKSRLPITPVQITLGGPDSQWKAMQQLYFFMIMTAEKKVQIQSPFSFLMKAFSKRSKPPPCQVLKSRSCVKHGSN